MKRLLVLIVIFALILADDTDTDTCKTGFSNILEQKCNSLSETGANVKTKCVYDGNDCKEEYTACDGYKPQSGFSDSICTSIKPSSTTKQCVVKNTSGKTCVEEDKVCSDGNNDPNNCPWLKAGDNKRCVYFPDTGECKEHYSDCDKVTTEPDCKNNIPKGHLNKCVWDSTQSTKCQQSLRTCSDGVAIFTDKNPEQTRNCFDLSAGDGRRCIISTSNNCEAHYEKCSDAPKESCSTNIPKDPTKDCGLNSAGNACEDKNRKCEDGLATINELNRDETKTCFDLFHGDNQRCILLDDGTCKTHYNNCADITKDSDCNANYPITGKDKKCIWEKKSNSNDYECKDFSQ